MRAAKTLRAFGRDERGAILVFWAIGLGIFLGLVALSLDIGRMASTQTELQSYADQVALAAAGELDGRPDAITRATNAAANLIQDSQTFGNGSQVLSGPGSYTLDFYATLPTSDTGALPSATTNPVTAVFARVVIPQRAVTFNFARAFFQWFGTAPTTNTVGATAIAGYTQYACDIAPMMFCIPSPSFDADLPTTKGDMIRLRAGGQGAAWGPGNFGFLEPSTLALDATGNCNGINGTGPMLRCVLGAVNSITQCFAVRGVDTEPGQKVGITNDSLNTRFDMWSGAMASEKNNPIYAPAPNVIKGIRPKNANSCNWNQQQPTPDTAALPRDDCFASTCAPYGDGTWSTGRANYVLKNYGGTDPHPSAVTRYDYYLAEIAAAGGAASTNPILTGRSETGRRMCSANQHPDPERRVIIAAGIDCAANPIQGSSTAVPVHQFVRMFITEPVVNNGGGSTTALDIYAEIIGAAGGPGSGSSNVSGIFRDVVQLYR
jgi:Flp pilus assembly protein TadG